MTEPPSPEYIPAKHQGGHQSVIKRIVMHGTVSDTECGGAYDIARYFQDPTYVSSAHYVVDPCEEYQCVYDHTVAWHDGTNTNSIGVEMCDPVEGPLSRWNDDPHEKMLRRTAALVRELCLAYDIPMRHLTPQQIRNGEKGICGHDDMRDAFPGSTSHWDPGAFPWDRFLNLVRNGEEEDELSKKAEEQINDIWESIHEGIPGKRWPGKTTLTIRRALRRIKGIEHQVDELHAQWRPGVKGHHTRGEAAKKLNQLVDMVAGLEDLDPKVVAAELAEHLDSPGVKAVADELYNRLEN